MRFLEAPATSEATDAAVRTVIALTGGVGAFVALTAVANGTPPITAIPTAVLVASIAASATRIAAWASLVVWLGITPGAPPEAVVVPVGMAVASAAIAVGPARLVEWAVRDVAALPSELAGGDHAAGWLEELEDRPIG